MIIPFLIISLILFHGINIDAVETDGLESIDVLATLKKDAPNCNLRDFVKSDTDLQKLNGDLGQYCSASETPKKYALICQMLAYELQKACALPKDSRPTPAIYDKSYKASEVCDAKNVQMTSAWIFNKISKNGKINLETSPAELCEKVTSNGDVIRLTRFFYKIAPMVRKADSSKQNKDNDQTDTNDKSAKESAVEPIKTTKETVLVTAEAAKDKAKGFLATVASKASQAIDAMKEKGSELAESVKNKFSSATDNVKDGAKQTADAAKQGAQDAAEQTVDKAKTVLKQDADSVSNTTSQVIDAGKQGAKDAGDQVADKAKQLGKDAKEKTDQAIDTAKQSAKDAGDQVADKTKQLGKDAKEKMDQAIDTAKQGAKDTGNQVVDKIKQLGKDAKEKTDQVVGAVKQGAKEVGDQVADKIKQLGKDAKEKTDPVVDAAKEATKGAKDSLDQNIDATKKGDSTKDTVEKTKPAVEGTTLIQNATKEIAAKLDDKEGDKDDKTKTDTEKDQPEVNDKDDDDENKDNQQQPKVDQKPKDDKKPKENEQPKDESKPKDNQQSEDDEKPKDAEPVGQIPKPKLPDKKEETKAEGQKTDTVDGTEKKTKDDGDQLANDYDDGERPEKPKEVDQPDKNDSPDRPKAVDPNREDEIRIRKPTNEDRVVEKVPPIKVPDSDPPKPPRKNKSRDRYGEDGWSGSFVTYFLLFTLFVVVGYLILHNKNKLMAYALEGRRSGGGSRTGSRPSHRGYEKLRNINDVIPIDEANPIGDRVIILKN